MTLFSPTALTVDARSAFPLDSSPLERRSRSTANALPRTYRPNKMMKPQQLKPPQAPPVTLSREQQGKRAAITSEQNTDRKRSHAASAETSSSSRKRAKKYTSGRSHSRAEDEDHGGLAGEASKDAEHVEDSTENAAGEASNASEDCGAPRSTGEDSQESDGTQRKTKKKSVLAVRKRKQSSSVPAKRADAGTRRWTLAEDELLLKGHKNNWSVIDTLERFGLQRSVRSSQRKLQELLVSSHGGRPRLSMASSHRNSSSRRDRNDRSRFYSAKKWSEEETRTLSHLMADGYEASEICSMPVGHYRSSESLRKKAKRLEPAMLREEKIRETFPGDKIEIIGWNDMHSIRLRRAYRETMPLSDAWERWFKDFRIKDLQKKMLAYEKQMKGRQPPRASTAEESRMTEGGMSDGALPRPVLESDSGLDSSEAEDNEHDSEVDDQLPESSTAPTEKTIPSSSRVMPTNEQEQQKTVEDLETPNKSANRKRSMKKRRHYSMDLQEDTAPAETEPRLSSPSTSGKLPTRNKSASRFMEARGSLSTASPPVLVQNSQKELAHPDTAPTKAEAPPNNVDIDTASQPVLVQNSQKELPLAETTPTKAIARSAKLSDAPPNNDDIGTASKPGLGREDVPASPLKDHPWSKSDDRHYADAGKLARSREHVSDCYNILKMQADQHIAIAAGDQQEIIRLKAVERQQRRDRRNRYGKDSSVKSGAHLLAQKDDEESADEEIDRMDVDDDGVGYVSESDVSCIWAETSDRPDALPNGHDEGVSAKRSPATGQRLVDEAMETETGQGQSKQAANLSVGDVGEKGLTSVDEADEETDTEESSDTGESSDTEDSSEVDEESEEDDDGDEDDADEGGAKAHDGDGDAAQAHIGDAVAEQSVGPVAPPEEQTRASAAITEEEDKSDSEENSSSSGSDSSSSDSDSSSSGSESEGETNPEPAKSPAKAPATKAPTTKAAAKAPAKIPATKASTTKAPAKARTTKARTTKAPTTEAPTTEAPTTEAPTTEAPTTEAPTTKAPTTKAPAKVPAKAPAKAPTKAPTKAPAPAKAPAGNRSQGSGTARMPVTAPVTLAATSRPKPATTAAPVTLLSHMGDAMRPFDEIPMHLPPAPTIRQPTPYVRPKLPFESDDDDSSSSSSSDDD